MGKRGADRTALVTGATGFIGSSLATALRRRGYSVRGVSRHPPRAAHDPIEWVQGDLLSDASLAEAFRGVDVAYYLVHSMGSGNKDFRDQDRQAARAFVTAAERAGVKRVVYLGGISPKGHPSEHLASRVEVGEILRRASVPTIELRASMIIGNGSASWKIVRDLAMRLPAMVLPSWLQSRTRPVALEDVVEGLVAAADLPIEKNTWFDIPGPDVLTGEEILRHIAGVAGRQIRAISVPMISPRMSAMWLKFVTGADYSLARELVLGFEKDLLTFDDRFWKLTEHGPLIPFDVAARRALADEAPARTAREQIGHVVEALASRIGSTHAAR